MLFSLLSCKKSELSNARVKIYDEVKKSVRAKVSSGVLSAGVPASKTKGQDCIAAIL